MWLAYDATARSLRPDSVDFSSANWQKKNEIFSFIVSSNARMFIFPCSSFSFRCSSESLAWEVLLSLSVARPALFSRHIVSFDVRGDDENAPAPSATGAHTHVQTLMRHLISAWFSKSSARFTCAKMIQFHLTIRTIGRPSQQILIIAYYNFPFSCDLHNLEIERNWKNRAFIQQEISELVRIKETHFPVNEWVCECLCRNDLWRRREKIHELLTTAHALIPRAQIFSEQRARSSVRTKLCIACTSNYRTNREKGLSLSLSENKLNCLRASNKFGIHFRKAAATILSGTRTNLIFVRTSTKSILTLGKKKQFFEFNWAKVSQVENVHSRDKSISAKSCVKLRADCDVSR